MTAKRRLIMLGPRVPTADTRIAPPAPKPAKIADPFYSSTAWLTLRDAERVAAGGICRRPGCGKPGHTVDHIREIRDGGARASPRPSPGGCKFLPIKGVSTVQGQ